MPNYSLLKERFVSHFGPSDEAIHTFYAPGRVNLIGEHTDYNGGHVFPAALTLGTTLLIRKRTDKRIGLLSSNFPLTGEHELSALSYKEEDNWMNYPKGIVQQLISRGYTIESGYDLFYHGEIPNGSGLSSSASIEVVTAFAILTLIGAPINLVDIALLSQKTENEYIGVQSGIMDQFAVANGKKGFAMMLMCDTLQFEYVPFNTDEYKLIISNTNKRRDLLDSKYNERRAQCEAAVSQLRAVFPQLKLLGELTPSMLEAAKHVINDEVIYNRAKHVVEENARVVQSVQALNNNDFRAFGELMNASHASLRDLYEVTGHELDSLVYVAQKIDGVLGSRMTGAGFGGCTISLVHNTKVNQFITSVGQEYLTLTGIKADFYVCEIGHGVQQMD